MLMPSIRVGDKNSMLQPEGDKPELPGEFVPGQEVIKAIVWDLDGTLVDSGADLASALNSVLKHHGFAGHPVETVRSMIGNGVPKLLERGFRRAGIPMEPAQLDAVLPVFMATYTACATRCTRPYPNVVEVLDHFHNEGIPMGLCTNKPETISRKILTDLGLAVYFDSVVGGDSTRARKPHPLPLQTCLDELGVAAESSLMIGDSAADVGAARAAGVSIGVVTWGYTRVPVGDLGADFVLDSLTNLPRRVLSTV
jgi:phosphoglycolate phosphatase